MVVTRLGPGRVVLLGCLVFVVGSVVAWQAPVFPVLAVGRLVQGIGLGIVPAGVLAGMMAGARAERAGGSMALYQSALSLGGAIGPAVGGPLPSSSTGGRRYCSASWPAWRQSGSPSRSRLDRLPSRLARSSLGTGSAGRRRSSSRWCCSRIWQPFCSG
jgi:MFS family permease